MNKQTFYLRNEQIRRNLINAIMQLPIQDHHPLTVELKEFNRTILQNDMFHAICGDVAKQAEWQGKTRKPFQWKNLFISGHAMATGLGAEVVHGLENEFVNIRESSAQMGVKRMASLIEYTQAWSVGEGIQLREVRYSNDYYGRGA